MIKNYKKKEFHFGILNSLSSVNCIARQIFKQAIRNKKTPNLSFATKSYGAYTDMWR